MEIRPVRPDEYARLGEITVEAYAAVEGYVPEADYEDELRDIATRAEAPATVVLAAVDDQGDVLGGVTYVTDPSSPLAEHDGATAAGIRMLAVDPAAQGRGVGEALVRACLDRARADARTEIVLHSTVWMHAAHRLYGRLGFERDPLLDWTPVPTISLIGFRLPLGVASR